MKKNENNSQIISRSLMRLLSFAVILAFMVPMTMNAQSGKANFTGNWTYNASKSTPAPTGGGGGGRGGFGGGNFTAKQDANLLSVDRTRNNQDGQPVTTTSKYTLDGKESVNKTGMAETKSIVKWSADGKSLSFANTMSFTRNGETTERKSSEAWTLTNPNTLSITTTSTTQDGTERKMTRVYDKK